MAGKPIPPGWPGPWLWPKAGPCVTPEAELAARVKVVVPNAKENRDIREIL